MKIEKLKYSELKEYKRLIDKSFENSSGISKYKKMYNQDKNYEILVAKKDNKIIGSLTILKIDLFTFDFQPMLELFNVCVDSSYRENKVGTKLIKYVVDFAKKERYNSIALTCLENLPYIHSFYENVGFKKADSRKYMMEI